MPRDAVAVVDMVAAARARVVETSIGEAMKKPSIWARLLKAAAEIVFRGIGGGR